MQNTPMCMQNTPSTPSARSCFSGRHRQPRFPASDQGQHVESTRTTTLLLGRFTFSLARSCSQLSSGPHNRSLNVACSRDTDTLSRRPVSLRTSYKHNDLLRFETSHPPVPENLHREVRSGINCLFLYPSKRFAHLPTTNSSCHPFGAHALGNEGIDESRRAPPGSQY